MTILLLGDLTGRSRVALRMLTYELEARGHEVLALPTALISNTLNLGSAAMLDTTDYLMRSLETWEKLGLTYDALYIGFVTGVAQAEKLCEIAEAASPSWSIRFLATTEKNTTALGKNRRVRWRCWSGMRIFLRRT